MDNLFGSTSGADEVPDFSASNACAVAVRKTFSEPRSKSERYRRHPQRRKLTWSNGVNTVCVLTRSFWLLDLIGGEASPRLLANVQGETKTAVLRMKVCNSSATIYMTLADDVYPIWNKKIVHTNFPAGQWPLYLSVDSLADRSDVVTVLRLPSEMARP